jgi:hypothetical protein
MPARSLNTPKLLLIAAAAVGFLTAAILISPSPSTAGSLGSEESPEPPATSGNSYQSPAGSLGSLVGPQLNIDIFPSPQAPLYTATDAASDQLIAERFTADQSASLLAEYDIDLESAQALPAGAVDVPLEDF